MEKICFKVKRINSPSEFLVTGLKVKVSILTYMYDSYSYSGMIY